MSSHAIYSLLGNIAVMFATIEHRLLNLLEYLLTNDDDNCCLVRPYVLDDLPLSKRIEKIRTVAQLRLWDHSLIMKELNKVLNDVDDLRAQRNLFIHGDWFKEDLTENATSVTVLNYRPRLDKKTGAWTNIEPVRVSDTKLKTMLNKVDAAFRELTCVDNKIREVELR